MYKMTTTFLFALFVSGCLTAGSQDISHNGSAANVQPSGTPVDANQALERLKTLFTPTPTPTPLPNAAPINDADYTVLKLAIDKMTKTTLDKQPPEIIEYILRYDTQSSPRAARKISIRTEERDFNRDGISERIIYLRHHDNKEGVPALYIFRNESKSWKNPIFRAEGAPGVDIPQLEFLTKFDSSDFDLIKKTYEPDLIVYSQLQNGEYKSIQCQKMAPEGVKVVFCR